MTNLVLPNGIVVDDALFDRIKTASLQTVKLSAPNPDTRYKTSSGDLALKAVKLRRVNRHKLSFTVYVKVNIAPYMPYVTKKTHWKDGTPYEYHEWFKQAAQDVAQNIADIVGGKVVKS